MVVHCVTIGISVHILHCFLIENGNSPPESVIYGSIPYIAPSKYNLALGEVIISQNYLNQNDLFFNGLRHFDT